METLSALWMGGLEAKGTTLLLVMMRMGAMFSLMPWWRHKAIPWRFVVGALVLISVLVVSGLGWPSVAPAQGVLGWALMLGAEVLFGLALGLVVQVALAIANGMSQAASQAMGLGFATAIDPSSGQQGVILDKILVLFLLILALVMDVHLVVVEALAQTFKAIPPGAASALNFGAWPVAELGQHMLWTSLRLGAPVMAISLMVQVALAVIARVVPQMNLLTLGLTISIPVGMLCLVLTSHVTWSIWQAELADIGRSLIDVTIMMRPK